MAQRNQFTDFTGLLSYYRTNADPRYDRSYSDVVTIYDTEPDNMEFSALNPRKILNITINGTLYRTLLHYLFTLILCNDKDKISIQDLSIEAVVKFMIDNWDSLFLECKTYYQQIGNTFGDNSPYAFTTGLEYVIRAEAGNLRPVLLKRPEIYQALKETGNRPITYVPPVGMDFILGYPRTQIPNIPEYLNINLVGELYEDIRVGMRNFAPMSVTSNLSIAPEILRKWVSQKIVDVTTCLSHFYQYISEDRNGFYQVIDTPITPLQIPPMITYEMISYILEDIFPCLEVKIKYPTIPTPPDVKATIDLILNANSTKFPKFIPSEMYQKIWDYVSALADVIVGGTNMDPKLIQEKIINTELKVLMKRECEKDWGFDDEFLNCCAQSFLYVIISCSDWLELDSVHVTEIQTAANIIIPDLKISEAIISDPKKMGNNLAYNKVWMSMFREKGLLIDITAANLLSEYLNKIKALNFKTDNDLRQVNRLMFFANLI